MIPKVVLGHINEIMISDFVDWAWSGTVTGDYPLLTFYDPRAEINQRYGPFSFYLRGWNIDYSTPYGGRIMIPKTPEGSVSACVIPDYLGPSPTASMSSYSKIMVRFSDYNYPLAPAWGPFYIDRTTWEFEGQIDHGGKMIPKNNVFYIQTGFVFNAAILPSYMYTDTSFRIPYLISFWDTVLGRNSLSFGVLNDVTAENVSTITVPRLGGKLNDS